MPLTPKNFIRHEIIGLGVRIDEKNVDGVVVDETKKMITIRTEKGDKKYQKSGTKFLFKTGSFNIMVNGDKMVARPEERIKSKVKKW